MAAQAKTITSLAPDYFDIGHYQKLLDTVAEWRGMTEIAAERLLSADDHAAICRLLYLEARLLDSGRLTDWLDLFTEDCVYWLPTDVEGRDPRLTVAWEMNDRRRLEERVERLSTGRAFSQAPPTRTTHFYTNIESFVGTDGTVQVLCQFLIHTNLDGRVSQRAGWNGYVLRQVAGAWRIVVKRISMFDADMPQNNNSFTL